VGVASVWAWLRAQYLLLHGLEVDPGAALGVPAPPAGEAQQGPEGAAHVAVPEGVDDGVHQRVALRQHQEVLLILQHVAALAAQAVQQQDHQAGGPAQHEAAWGGGNNM